MTLHNPFAGETPFPLAGEDVILKFTTSNILQLYTLYGPDPREAMKVEPGTNRISGHFWTTLLGRAEMHDPHVLFNLLKVGLKQRDGDRLVPLKRPAEWWDDLPFSFADTADIITAGVTWSRWGMTPDQLADMMRQQAAQVAEEIEGGAPENPPTATTESPTSFAS